MIHVEPGARFRVTGIKEVRDSQGKLLARYHPTHPETGEPLDYAVTTRNVGIVNRMIEDGAAVAETARDARRAQALEAGAAKARGKVTVTKKGKAK